LEWVSAAEGARFAEIVTSLTEKIREMGPLGTESGKRARDLRLKLQAAKAAVSGEKLRWVAAKQTEFITDGNKYGEIFTSQEIGRLLDGVIVEEMASQQILALLARGALSVKELAQRLDLPPPDVMRHVLALQRKELVRMCEVRDRSPLYTTMETNG
jgi:DNA-binding transcriptional ArsR family regulator